MKKNGKQRLFEVMSRLDKTFKPKLNEGYFDETTIYNDIISNFGRPPQGADIRLINDENVHVLYYQPNPEAESWVNKIKSKYINSPYITFTDTSKMKTMNESDDIEERVQKIIQMITQNDLDLANGNIDKEEHRRKEKMYSEAIRTIRASQNMNEDINDFDVDEILNSYLETAFWAEQSEENGLIDKTIFDVDEESKNNSKADIENFINLAKQNAADELETYDAEQIGHNLWLSRNGHGAGFFDDNNDKLQDIARNMKEVNIYVGDDNKVYIQ